MIDRNHKLPVKRQCELLGVARSTAYYRPEAVSQGDLEAMRRIDELHLRYPFAGSRMLCDWLRREGFDVGRRHVRTLMQRMGIHALYRRPRTTIPEPRQRSTLTCSKTSALNGLTKSGRPTSPTSRWPRALPTSWPSWTWPPAGSWRGDCPIP